MNLIPENPKFKIQMSNEIQISNIKAQTMDEESSYPNGLCHLSLI